jgi:hypothetical protein
LNLVFIVISAVVCGCNEWKEIKWWCEMEANQKWIRKYIELPNGMPSLSTIGRFFNIISPKQLELCFADWMKCRKGCAPQNMAVVKRIAFNMAKKDTIVHSKESMKTKRFIASMDFKYRDHLININLK